jgi:hypothetical protein
MPPVEVIKFETYSALEALQTLAKIHGLEGTPINIHLGIDEQRQVNFLVNLVKRLHAQALSEGEQITVEGVVDEVIQWEKEYQDKDLASLKRWCCSG